MAEHILQSFRFDGAGKGTRVSFADIASLLKEDALGWIHLDATQPETRGWLDDCLGYLDPFIVSALLAEETRPRVTRIGDGLLVILRGINTNEGDAVEDMVSVRIYIDPHRIISVQRRRVKAVLDIAHRLETGTGPVDAGDFLAQLVDRLTDRVEPVLREIEDEADVCEEDVIDNPNDILRQRLIGLRKTTLGLRRYLSPQRDAIATLLNDKINWLGPVQERHLSESFSRSMRAVEDLDALRERFQIIKDELANTLANRLNNNLYILSIVGAIFLPLGFFTGLLGVNVGGIPGSDSPIGFTIFSVILGIFVLLEIWLFKRLKWI